MSRDSLWVDCLCDDFNHSLRISVDIEDKDAWIETRLNKYQPFYKRIIIGLIYIFGMDGEDQEFDVTLIDGKKAKDIISILEKIV